MSENNLPTVSVVVPVFNTEKWLTDCINSLAGQTYHRFEVILVDDGSTDGSGKICDEFAASDWRTRVIHEENRGLSAARNAGAQAATGEYLMFLDSDDYIDADAVEKLATAAAEADADIVATGFVYTYPDREESAISTYGQDTCFGNHDAVEELVSGRIPNFAWGKLIKTSLVRGHMFPEGKLFEDHYWTHLIFGDSERVLWLEAYLFHYRQREGSISYTYTPDRLDMLDGWRARCVYLDERYPDLKPVYLCFLSKQFPPACWLVLTRMKRAKKKAFLRLRSFSADFKLAECASEKDRILISALDRSVFSYAVTALFERIFRK